MKIILFANTEWYFYNFRLSLLKTLKNKGYEVVLVTPPGVYGEKLLQEGFRWIPLDMQRRSLNPFNELLVIKQLIKLYQAENPAIVHHFTIKPVIYGSLSARVAGVACRVNAVTGLGHVFIGNSNLARLIRPFVSVLLKLAFKAKNSILILQNSDDQHLFLNNGLVDKDSIRIIRGSGVNIHRFFPQQEYRTTNKIKILLATRLLWEKGIGEFIEAAQLLLKRHSNLEFLLGGSPDVGNPASVPSDQIEAWHNAGIIKALGHVDDIAPLMQDVDIVVLPSYREGTPKVLLEAAACGLPIVTTDVPGCREVVDHEINGLLVPPKNANALAAAIERLVENTYERRLMGQKGREKITLEFEENIVISRTIEVYTELLSSDFSNLKASNS